MNILVLNGVNLNMTGRREKGVYGTQTLREINERIERFAEKLGVTVKSVSYTHLTLPTNSRV